MGDQSLRLLAHVKLIRLLSQWPGVKRRDAQTQIVFSVDGQSFCWVWRSANMVQIAPPLGAKETTRQLKRAGDKVRVVRAKTGAVDAEFYDPECALRPVWSYPGFTYPGLVSLKGAISLIRQSYEWASRRQSGKRDSSVDAAPFEKSLRFYSENFQALRRTYAGKYIALIDNQVVDFDGDFSALAERVYKKVGYLEIFMPKVEERRPIHIPTPRLH